MTGGEGWPRRTALPETGYPHPASRAPAAYPAPRYPDVAVQQPDPSSELARHSLVYRVSAALARAGVPEGEVRLFEDSAAGFTSYENALREARAWVTVTP